MTRPARPLSRKRSTGSCGTADSRPTSRLSRYQTDALRHSGSVVFAFYPGIVGPVLEDDLRRCAVVEGTTAPTGSW